MGLTTGIRKKKEELQQNHQAHFATGVASRKRSRSRLPQYDSLKRQGSLPARASFFSTRVAPRKKECLFPTRVAPRKKEGCIRESPLVRKLTGCLHRIAAVAFVVPQGFRRFCLFSSVLQGGAPCFQDDGCQESRCQVVEDELGVCFGSSSDGSSLTFDEVSQISRFFQFDSFQAESFHDDESLDSRHRVDSFRFAGRLPSTLAFCRFIFG